MAERYFGAEPERRPIDHEIFDLNDGPFDIALAEHRLRIVVPERDLNEGWNVDCLIIDPNDYSPNHESGFKGLRDGEEVILGRKSTQGRFDFSPYVSARHVILSRQGNEVAVHDLGSTNGTYHLVPRHEDKSTYRVPTQQVGGTHPEFANGSVKLAGFTVPSDWHPERNEDAVFVDEPSMALGVFDGVGGAPGSERASQLASKAVEQHL